MAAVRAAAEEDPAEGALASVDVLRAARESVLTKGCVTATLAQVCVSLSYSYHTHDVFLPKGLVTAEASWSTWGSWSSCTKTCGRGRSDRYRSCSGGSTCPGDGSEARWCNNNSCPGHLVKQSCLPVKSTSLYLSWLIFYLRFSFSEAFVSERQERPKRGLTKAQRNYCNKLVFEQLLTTCLLTCCCQCSGRSPRSCTMRGELSREPIFGLEC